MTIEYSYQHWITSIQSSDENGTIQQRFRLFEFVLAYQAYPFDTQDQQIQQKLSFRFEA